MSILSLKNISYKYPLENNETIHDVSFEFEKGRVYGLVGANESGKTTLCNIIRGFIPELYKGQLVGDVMIKGKHLNEYNIGELATIIGYSFQNPFTQLSGVKDTVYEEIAYGMENIGVPRDEMIKKVNDLVKMFRLEDLINKNPFELSGGQKQRVAIASIIALDPEFIILDEPTSQLDPKSSEDIFKIIHLLKKQGKTILLVDHKVDLLAEYCDEILLMSKGQLAMTGPTKEILADPKVLKYGGQLPQVALYYIQKAKDNHLKTTDTIPLTVQEVQDILRKDGEV
ncbi:energy-coupling factor ABC transporter ATP-binding protein [Heyndrickxia oleronia]|uniref:ABC transporter ATP-binding protein n=1 Tax=Heyndrickxia oleronia TaxID=38875 RepID=A0A8E2LCJ2_9BACI|nr:ABC transporter ATP-binding protein [Heyndrickxia oleronia]OJH17173.1 ABC transporter ATP-binding protein [Bacillus obstructivus]MCM3456844.1 energy-coupling factor ABC transporter ATP-binding protein [Heyndrickxia oleronia]MEC1376832.1 ABC transporter ATP-binding protein [Heyndrickxia oleronia]OOP67060.1 ABC transporter ATP-binding protein [Heyndrickxia oleronia]QQZ03677.1 ABC transporter ATP-binding protein [Heyndrickxia oleronia]